MKRRSFLKSAAYTFPIALSQPFVLDTRPSDFPIKEAHVVLAGADIDSQNRRSVSAASPSRFPHRTRAATSSSSSTPIFSPGGPPLHLHYDQEEWFYVMEGEVLVQIGERRFQLKPGDSVLAPRKVPHAFTAVVSTPAKMHVGYSPAGKMEQFFRDIAKGNPVPLDAALFRKYGCELIGPPLKTT